MRPILLLLLSISSFVSIAQSDYEIIERLDKAGLLTSNEKKEIVKWTKQTEKLRNEVRRDPDAYIDTNSKKVSSYPLSILCDAKKFSTPGTRSIFSFSIDKTEIPEAERPEVIGKLNEFAGKILQAKLITEKTYEELLGKIRSFECQWELEVAHYAMLATNREHFFSPKYFKPFADSLLSKDIISKESYEELMSKVTAGALRKYEEYFKYLKNAVIIDFKPYSDKPEEYLEAVHRKTAEAFPGIAFEKFSYSIELNKKESFENFKSYNLVVTIQQGSKTYKHSSYYDLEGPEALWRPGKLRLDPNDYYQIFNKMLAEQESPYRLHVFNATEPLLGVIALTKKQSENLQWMYDGMILEYINLSYENFSNKLNQRKIADAVATYESIGLIDLSVKEKESFIQELLTKDIHYYNDILGHFKGLVFDIDLEYGIETGQYKKLTEEIAAISRGHFKPEAIIDGYKFKNTKKNVFEYGFTLNGKKYLEKLEQNDDWLDGNFWELIDRAVKAEDKVGAFYYLPPADGLRVIYLTNEQAKVLKQKKAIELSEADLETN